MTTILKVSQIRTTSAIISLFTILAACGLAVTIAYTPWEPYFLIATALVLLITLTSAGTVFYLLMCKQIIIQPITIYLATCFGYVTSAIFLMNGGQSRSYAYYLTSAELPHFVKALFYVWLGITCYIVAYLMTAQKQIKDVDNSSHYEVSTPKLAIIIISLAILGFTGYFFFVQSSGGLRYLAQNIYARNSLRTTEYYRALFQLTMVATWIWFAYDKHALQRLFFWPLALTVLVALLSLGNRGVVILYVISFIVLHIVVKGKNENTLLPKNLISWLRKTPLLLLLAAFIIVVMFGMLAWREASFTAKSKTGDITVDLISEKLLRYNNMELLLSTFLGQSNLAGIESLSTIIEFVPSDIPYLYGQTFYWTVMMPIPRFIWPDKPTTLGIFIKRAIIDSDATGGGVPPTWIGELYINFGVLGIVCGNFLFGFISARIYNIYRRHFHSKRIFFRLLYSFYSIYFVFYLTKTEFRTALYRFLVIVFVLWIVDFVIRKRQTKAKQLLIYA